MMHEILGRLKDEPVLFVKEILGVEPDDWQAETLKALAQNSRVAVRSGHRRRQDGT